MKIIDKAKFRDFCENSNIDLPDRKLNIGRELTYRDSPLRTIVIHVVESDSNKYILKLFDTILSIERFWILTPRFTYNDRLKIRGVKYQEESITFEPSEKEELCEYLLNHRDNLRSIVDDLYLLGESGNVIMLYDLHMEADGLPIFLNDISQAGKLLLNLNSLGAEFEVFGRNG